MVFAGNWFKSSYRSSNQTSNHNLIMPASQSFMTRLLAQLPSIVKQYGTPFHIYDEFGIEGTCVRLAQHMPTEFQEFFAVKALPDPAILRIMARHGYGFDCSSIPELILARETGATPDQIMFTSNDTTTREFREALDLGCIINLDDISFLDTEIIRKRMPELICFRLNPGHRQTGNSIIGNPLEAKYGIEWDQLVPAYARARELGAKRFGLHTMIASNDLDHEHMLATAKLLLEAAILLKKELGIEVEFINVGGGIGIPYRPEQEEFNLEEYGRGLRLLLDQFKDGQGFVPRLFMESGRYMTGPHGVYVTRALNRKDIYGQIYVGVECAMPALMRPAMYGAYHEITVVDALANRIRINGEYEHVHVVGPICENCDRLTNPSEPRLLPKIRIGEESGDLIVVHNTGAHGAAMGFNYNGRERPQGLLLRSDGSVVMTRRGETIEHLLWATRGL